VCCHVKGLFCVLSCEGSVLSDVCMCCHVKGLFCVLSCEGSNC